MEAVCKAYGVGENELLRSKRGTFNEPRNGDLTDKTTAT